MKIVILDAATVTANDISFECFDRFGEVVAYDLTPQEKLVERIIDADMVITNKCVLTASIMEQAKKLKYIGLFATGYNNIDVEYANAHNITVCNAPGYSTQAVAQHTFAFILAILNRVGEYNETVKNGDWIKSRTFSYFPLPCLSLIIKPSVSSATALSAEG